MDRRCTLASKLALIEPRPVPAQIGNVLGRQTIDPRMGADASSGRLDKILMTVNPLVPVNLVIDHSSG